MYILKLVILYTAIYFLRFESFLFLIRAILSWINPMNDGKIQTLIYNFTEPFIIPFRKLFNKYGWFASTPIDMPFMFACLAIMMLQTLLSLLF